MYDIRTFSLTAAEKGVKKLVNVYEIHRKRLFLERLANVCEMGGESV